MAIFTGTNGNDILPPPLSDLSGNDSLSGLGGNDSLSGGNGNDTLNGGTGNDTMIGGAGNDVYIVDSSNDVVTEALNQGTDLVNSSITYTLGANLENLTLTDTTNINGTGNTLNNNITGNSGNNILNGGDGNDTLIGNGGDDNLNGGVGNDFLDGGTGINILNGGDGNDTLIPATGNSVDDGGIVDGGAGTDTLTVDFSNANFEDLNYDGLGIYNHSAGINSRYYDTRLLTISNIEIFNIKGTLYNDHLVGEESDTLDGGAGYDTLSLNLASATTTVQVNLDQTTNQVTYNNTVVKNFENIGTITTGSGNDTINLGSGNGVDDNGTVDGGTNTDTLIVDFSNANFEDLNYDGLGIYNHSAGINSRYYDTRLLTISNIEIFNIKGTLYNDHLVGEESDTLDGGDGYDTLTLNFATATGNVQVNLDQTTNQVTYNNTVVKNFESIGTITTGSGNDTINLGSGNGVDDNGTVDGGTNTDTLIVDFSNANFEDLNYDGLGIYNHSAGINSRYYDTRLLTISNIEIFNIKGTLYNDHLVGEESDTLDGGDGYDTLNLNFATATGNVQVNFDQTTNQVTYNNTVVKNFENISTITTGSGNDVINLGSANGVDDGGTVNGGAGTDTLIVDFSNANFEDLNYDGLGIYNNSGGINSRYYGNRLLTIKNIEVFNIKGTPYADDLRGFALNDTLNGGNGDDIINGFAGNDFLDGGNGADTMIGGAGNDIYTVNSTGDRITENVNEGTDTVQSSITYTLGNNLENLILTGSSNLNGMGNTLNNIITGNSGNNTLNGGDGNDTLDGGVGVDTLIGGKGNDTYTIDNVGDVITEALNEGTDLVNSSITYTLGDNVENLTLTGTTNINGTGNALDNVITGNSGNNTLNGGIGNDSLIGGNGNDVYIVDNTGDRITESANQGIDRVNSSVTYSLSTNVENLTLTGTGNINGTGNALDNVITGNSSNNILNGSSGADTLIGGNGNDTYTVDNLGDVIQETSNITTEIDTVQSNITYILGANLENLTLTGTTAINGIGNTLNNTITGNTANNTLSSGSGNDTLNGGSGNDTLNGGSGADSLIGGIGDDFYLVDNIGDGITENVDQGNDTVQSTITHTLGENLENLILTGNSNINGTGNALNNNIFGNDGNNSLVGGDGNDYVDGGVGNDTLNGGNGDDYIYDAGYGIGQNNLFGGDGNDTLIAGDGNDTLDGGVGNDSLVGGNGNELYIVDNSGDRITEALNAGTDLVNSSITYTLGANLENLTLTGIGHISGTGNTLNNRITGNTANNILSGSSGNDTLIGSSGNDTLIGGVGNDTLIGGVGNDFFIFNSTSERIDQITDYNVINDTIRVSSSGFGGGLVAGALLSNQFTIGSSATTSAQRFIYNSSNGGLFFDVDGNGATAAVQFATLNTGLALTNQDILVV